MHTNSRLTPSAKDNELLQQCDSPIQILRIDQKQANATFEVRGPGCCVHNRPWHEETPEHLLAIWKLSQIPNWYPGIGESDIVTKRPCFNHEGACASQ